MVDVGAIIDRPGKKEEMPEGISSFLEQDTGVVCIFGLAENSGSAPSSRRRQQATGLLDLIFRFTYPRKKKRCRRASLLFWSRIRESNPRPWLGKRLFYH